MLARETKKFFPKGRKVFYYKFLVKILPFSKPRQENCPIKKLKHLKIFHCSLNRKISVKSNSHWCEKIVY